MWELTKEGFMTSFAGFLVSAAGSIFLLMRKSGLSFSSFRSHAVLCYCYLLTGDLDYYILGIAF